ncbi:JAML protein, partial [Xiphorhynchus elegans]|nr:JAML protein [Xiphorhynchus elegans]
MVFYYYSDRGVPVGRFKKRVQWQGSLSHWDGSIRLRDLRVNDSGTYECEIRLVLSSNIFRNHTVLHVSPPVQRGRGAPGAAQDSVPPRDSGFWPAVVGCGSVAMVVAFLAGLCVRKRYQHWLWVYGAGQSTSLQPSYAAEALYCSIPGAEIPKAEQDAKKKRRAEDIYITMHPSHCRENGTYVELSKRVIPAEWLEEGRQGDGQSEEPHSRPEEPLPRAPDQEK